MTTPAKPETLTPRFDALLESALNYQDGTEDMRFRRAIFDFARTLEKENAALRRALQACEKAMQNERSPQSGQWIGRGPGSHYQDALREARACLAAISQTEGT